MKQRLALDGLPKPVPEITEEQFERNRRAYFEATNQTVKKRRRLGETKTPLRVVPQSMIQGNYCSRSSVRCERLIQGRCEWFGDNLTYSETESGLKRSRPDRLKDCKKEKAPSRRQEGLR